MEARIMTFIKAVSACLLLFLILSHVRSFPFGFGFPTSFSRFSSAKAASPVSQRSWTSNYTIDPTRVLSALLYYSGPVLPKYLDRDIQLMRQTFHSGAVQLNPFERTMLLHNFTIGFTNQTPALRISRVNFQWDSYMRPCIDIEVDNVSVRVDFTNLMLTKNNWNELRKVGFPPTFATTTTTLSLDTEEFARFNSLTLSKNVTVTVESRPLQKVLGSFSVQQAAKEVDSMIRTVSQANVEKYGRRGCSSVEVTNILQTYFTEKVRLFLAGALREASRDPQSISSRADKILEKTKETILDYAGEAGLKSLMNIVDSKLSKLESFAKKNRTREGTDEL